MKSVRIIPCLDVDNGRVVKGVQFLDLIDAGDPVELASYYDKQGADELVFLDITASSSNRDTLIDVVERVGETLFIPFTVGGGIRTIEDARRLLRSGADKVALNSQAVATPSLITEIANEFGSQCVVVAIDAKRVNTLEGEMGPDSTSWQVYVKGGRQATGIDVLKWVRECQVLGAGEILLTSMDRDGTKSGYDLELTMKVTSAVSIPVIASGGVGTLSDLLEGVVVGGADALLAASIFHYKETSIEQVKRYLLEHSIMVRH